MMDHYINHEYHLLKSSFTPFSPFYLKISIRHIQDESEGFLSAGVCDLHISFKIFIGSVLGGLEWRSGVAAFLIPNYLYRSRTDTGIAGCGDVKSERTLVKGFFFIFFFSKIKGY